MDKYKEYADIELQIKYLEAKKALLKNDILKEDFKSVSYEYGKFTKSITKSYKYTDKVKALEEKVKLAKDREQQKGIATVVESPRLTFTPPKMN